jgi:hypothetical protein
MQIAPINGARTRGYFPFRVLQQDVEAAAGSSTWANGFASGPEQGSAGMALAQGVLMTDGRVLLVPRANSRPHIFTPGPDTLDTATAPAHGASVQPYFRCGVLLPNGRVLLVPDQHTRFLIYDPVSNTFSDGPAHGLTLPNTSTPAFSGAVVGQDDLVYLAPGAGAAMGIYDWRTNTLTFGASVAGLGGHTYRPFNGSLLLPNGDVAMICANTAVTCWRYRPSTNEMLAGPSGGGQVFSSGLWLPTRGEILLGPQSGTNARFWNVSSNAIRVGGTHGSDGSALQVCAIVPLRDGRAAMLPQQNATIIVYDPVTDAFSAGALTDGVVGSTNYRRGLALPDGRVFLIADARTNHGLWTPHSGGTPLPLAFLASRYINAL